MNDSPQAPKTGDLVFEHQNGDQRLRVTPIFKPGHTAWVALEDLSEPIELNGGVAVGRRLRGEFWADSFTVEVVPSPGEPTDGERALAFLQRLKEHDVIECFGDRCKGVATLDHGDVETESMPLAPDDLEWFDRLGKP